MTGFAETLAVEDFSYFSAKINNKRQYLPRAEVSSVQVSSTSVSETMRSRLESLDMDYADAEDAFFVADLGEVYRQQLRWEALLPRIEPFFAIKSNPDPLVIRLLASMGTGFDCASKAEIQQILDIGVDPSRIIYANPCKQASFIRYAAQKHVRMMTFDNAEELHKIKRYFPGAKLVLRILTDDSRSLCKLGLKFGASLDTTGGLLRLAKELDLNVIGVSFHVGSGCFDENAFGDAIVRARRVFDQAEDLGFDFTLLDVGGGFPGANVHDGITFEKVAAILGPIVDKLFPPFVRVIAEPGRYYVASAFTLAAHVIARRTVLRDNIKFNGDDSEEDPAIVNDAAPTDDDHPAYMYYLNDGLYGSFNCVLYDHQVVYPQVLMRGGIYTFGEKFEGEPEFNCSLWGPTCDSIDCINKNVSLPELNIGDWIYFENMGAYSICAASRFNGFRKSNIIYTNTEPALL